MRRLTLTQFMSLDGVVQSPGAPHEDPSGGFVKGGWLPPFFSDDVGAVIDARFRQAAGFVLGRRTYEIFAGHWPHVAGDPVADALNRLPKYVASTTLDSADWANTTILGGDVVDAVAELKEGDGGDLQLHGSGSLAQTLGIAGLIDVYELIVFPVVLGRGKRLFSDVGLDRSLRLVHSSTTPLGVNIVTYERGEPLTFGAVPGPGEV